MRTLASIGLLLTSAHGLAAVCHARGFCYHGGGFGGGFGGVHYSGATHWGPATGVTHYSGATAWGAGGAAHTSDVTHAGWGGTEHYSGYTAGGWGGVEHSSYGSYHTDYGAYGGYHSAYTYHPANYGSISHYDAYGYHVPGYYGGWGHSAGVYHGPYGGTAAYYHGPVVSGAAVKGPYGGTAAVYRGPFTAGAVATLPSGATAYAWRGGTYYHCGYAWYHPCYYGGVVCYAPVYPPTGFFFAALPVGAATTVVNNNTYYVADGVYYQPSAQGGQSGYAVVEPPGGAAPVVLPPVSGSGDPFGLLKKMSDYMGGQKHVVMKINEQFDELTAGGQKIQLGSERDIKMMRPDKLDESVSGPGVQRRMVYNNGVFTIIDQMRNVYSSVPMAGTLDSVLTQMGQQYGMAQPADELLYSDINAQLAGKISTGQYLGKERVMDAKCHHLAFTQVGVNWEIWIEEGDRRIPRKLVITYVGTPGRPQYTLLITKWDDPWIMSDSDFKANIPPGATSASMLTLAGQAPQGQ